MAVVAVVAVVVADVAEGSGVAVAAVVVADVVVAVVAVAEGSGVTGRRIRAFAARTSHAATNSGLQRAFTSSWRV